MEEWARRRMHTSTYNMKLQLPQNNACQLLRKREEELRALRYNGEMLFIMTLITADYILVE